MVVTQGYEEWLAKADRLAETEQEWAKMDRTELIAKVMESCPNSIVEFCCGTGWIPMGIPAGVAYTGIDANEGCIRLAEKKNPTRAFFIDDVRKFDVIPPHDMGLAFSCLKHFTLEDLDLVYGKLLRASKRTLTSVYMKPQDVEEQHHAYIHTAITMEHLERIIAENGHRLVQVFTLPPLNKHPEPLVLTERIDDGTGLVSTEGLRESGGGGDVPLRGELLGGVQGEAGDSGGESPDAGEGGDGERPPEGPATDWPC